MWRKPSQMFVSVGKMRNAAISGGRRRLKKGLGFFFFGLVWFGLSFSERGYLNICTCRWKLFHKASLKI